MSINSYFKISQRESNLRTEIVAGISTYLSLAYILIVNPSILSKAGIDPSVALFATAVASGLSCILMGLWARLPFVLAPGLEMNGFVAFSAVGLLGLSWQQALGAVFWSGVLCVLLTLLPARSKIIYSIPLALQSNLAFSVGVFVATIGLFLSKVILFDNGTPVGLGSVYSYDALVLYLSLLLCLALRHVGFFKNILGGLLNSSAFLISIVLTTYFCGRVGIVADSPTSVSLGMLKGTGALDLFPFVNFNIVTVFLVLFLIDFYGSIGKFIGLTAATNLRSTENGVVDIEKAMYVDGIGTIGGALLGTTSIITYVESAIGIQAGGRTGIVAIVCGLLMLLSLVFTPLISLVPVVATSGLLIYVGISLIPKEEIFSGKFSKFDLGVGLVMAILSFCTFSLDRAMLFGFGAYVFKQVISKDEKVNPYLLVSFLLLFVSVFMQYWLRS